MAPHNPVNKDPPGDEKAKDTERKKKNYDSRIKMVEKEGEKIFVCEECGNTFKTVGGANNHVAKKHRPRSEDIEGDEAKKAKQGEESDASFNDKDLDMWDDKEDEEITPSQIPSLEDMLKKYDSKN